MIGHNLTELLIYIASCCLVISIKVARYSFFLDPTYYFQLAFYQPSLYLMDVKITLVVEKG